MLRLFSIVIDVVSSLVIFIPVFLFLQFKILKSYSFRKKCFIFILGLYLLAAFSAVGIPDITSFLPDFDVNWIPFIDIVNNPLSYLKNTMLNVLLFIPFGCLLPIIWKDYRSMKKMLLTGLGFSFFIELLQLFNYRLSDIDDLFTNTAGTLLGYGVSGLIISKWQAAANKRSEGTCSAYEPLVVFTASFLVMFLIQPFISSAIWDILLASPLWESIR